PGSDRRQGLPQREFIGRAMCSDQRIEAFKRAYREARKKYEAKGFHEARTFLRASFSDMLQELIDTGHTVSSVPIFKGWVEVDSFEEYQQAWAKIRQSPLGPLCSTGIARLSKHTLPPACR